MTTTETNTAEWQEPNSVSLPTIVSSSDLFDGDLFGDELIDIYNAAVGEGTGSIPSEEIPTLMPQVTEVGEKKPDEVQSAVPADDGLGAFRPSTSFNDLTTFLPPGASSVKGGTGSAVSVVDNTTVSQNTDQNKKRMAGVEVEVPSAKKQCTELKAHPVVVVNPATLQTAPVEVVAQIRVEGGPAEHVTYKRGQVGVEGESCADEAATVTPNPLTYGTSNIAPVGTLLSNGGVLPSTVSSAAVVSPQLATQIVHRDNILPDSSSVHSAAASVPVPALSAPPCQTTEADFRAVAQAAVSSLIMNVGAAGKADSKTDSSFDNGDGKVDTSTAHVKALTGNNWVAACTGTSGCTINAAAAAENKANNRARRQNLTPDERAKQNRDRNREHARNTRLRKKAYVEELKRTLTELVSQRDANDLEKRQTAQRELDQREVRFRVIEEFLKLRGRNEVDSTRWAAILEEGFMLTIPVTSYRKMVHIENTQVLILEQVLTGVSEVMADSNNFASFLQSYGNGQTNTSISFVFNCDRKNFFMDGCNAVLDWTASSAGAAKQGARAELSLRGTLKAKFSPASNKLLSSNITFDTGLVTSQLSRFVGKPQDNTETCDEIVAAAAAAQAASCQADAILDSLQMPHIEAAVPSAVTVVPSTSAASITSSDKGESSSDESVDDSQVHCEQ